MSTPKRTQRTTGIGCQPPLISHSPGTSAPQRREVVEISHQGQYIPADLLPTPLRHVQYVVPMGRGPHPFGFPPALPIYNSVPSHRRMPTALDHPMRQPRFVSQSAPIEECDVCSIVDPYRPGVFDETDGEFEQPPSPFLHYWLNKSAQDSYELPELGSPPSNKPSEVGAPPGKRPWPFAGNMSPDELTDLHGSTLAMLQPPQSPQSQQPPQVRVFDFDEAWVRLKASSNPQKSTPKAPELPESRHLVNALATTRALPSEDPADLDPDALRLAVQGLSLGAHQRTLLALAEKNFYEEMVEFAKSLNRDEGAALWTQAQNWMMAPDPSERNPMASQLTCLLVLFTPYTPSLIELRRFMRLLPLIWPRALEHLRKDCLHRRAALVAKTATAARSALLDNLYVRYGNS